MPYTERHTRVDAVPYVLHKYVLVFLHYREEVKALIDYNVRKGGNEEDTAGSF